ncbi:MAG: alpha-amylase family glycosyl hydrolase [Bacteroidales bacterium]
MVGKKIIYQLLLRAFGKRDCIAGGSYDRNGSGKFNDISDDMLKRFKKLSLSAIWFTGVIAHATKTKFKTIPPCNASLVKGEAGSPYAIRNYFDVDPALAVNIDNRMGEFEAMVKRCHKAELDVIIDFVPNHVYREYTSYYTKDNFYYLDAPLSLPAALHSNYVEIPAKVTGNDCYTTTPSQNDWYDTVKLNYNNHSTWKKMLDVLFFWASKGVDGFRCDMVELVPAEFFGWALDELKRFFPNTYFIAEVYNKDNYRKYSEIGKFDYLYDKSGFYDALRAVSNGSKPASDLSHEWQFLGDLQPKMLNFLENHDEQRVASDYFAGSGKAAFPLLAVSLLFNTSLFMLYFGQEFGERGMEKEGFSQLDGRTSIYDYCSVPSIKRWLEGKLKVDEIVVYKEYCRLLRIATADSMFSRGMTFDLMYVNPTSDHFNAEKQFAFMRSYDGAAMVIVANFAYEPVVVDVFIPQYAFDYMGLTMKEQSLHIKVAARDYMRMDISNK